MSKQGHSQEQIDRKLHYIDTLNEEILRLKNIKSLYEQDKKLMKGFPVRGAVDCWINYQLRKMNAYSTKWNLIEQRWFDKSNNIYSFEKKYVVKSF